jgi:hypothetical protein
MGSVIFGQKDVIVFLELSQGIWLQALDMRIGWMAFPTTCSGRFVCQPF